MTKIALEVTRAFEAGRVMKKSNTFTNGKQLFLHDNMIAEWREDGMYVTNAGWATRTTKDRLNALSGVIVNVKKGRWYLNDEEWDGEWRKAHSLRGPEIDEVAASKEWNMEKIWVSSGGYRGRKQPRYAVCGAADTGTWSDSPCPSNVSYAEILMAEKALKASRIKIKTMFLETSNVFCQHRYVIVRPIDVPKAVEVIGKLIKENDFRLLYAINPNEEQK
jgi:hypothetical protein